MVVAAQKNNEAPRSFDSASHRRHRKRWEEIFLAEQTVCCAILISACCQFLVPGY